MSEGLEAAAGMNCPSTTPPSPEALSIPTESRPFLKLVVHSPGQGDRI